MSERQWTEGPWVATEVYRDEIGWPAVDVMAPGGWPECPVAMVRGRTAQEAAANARLAAAAPDLYEALELAVEKLREYADMDRWSQGEGGGCMSDPDAFVREAVEKGEASIRKARCETNE